jgi:hypothetical protein
MICLGGPNFCGLWSKLHPRPPKPPLAHKSPPAWSALEAKDRWESSTLREEKFTIAARIGAHY